MGDEDHPAARNEAEHGFSGARALQRQAEVGPEAGVLGQVGNAEHDAFNAKNGHDFSVVIASLMRAATTGVKCIIWDRDDRAAR